MLRKEFEKGINLMSLFIALTVKLSFSMINYIFITPESITIHFYCYLSRYIYLLLRIIFFLRQIMANNLFNFIMAHQSRLQRSSFSASYFTLVFFLPRWLSLKYPTSAYYFIVSAIYRRLGIRDQSPPPMIGFVFFNLFDANIMRDLLIISKLE